MKRMLFNATQAEELRVAIVDGQTLLDLDIETLGKEQRKGNIYKGVITRIEPSLEACFVDYGTDRHGFLPFKEVSRSYFQDYEGGRARIQDVLKEGMEVIVQVEKDERGNKGAALTTFISLAGRYLVLMPNNPRGGGVSRRIEGEERAELKAAMAELDVPRGMSLIARTAGIGRSVEELQWDFDYLLKLWRAIEEAGEAHKEPYLLFMESSLLIRAIRDYYRPDIGEILVDNQEVYDQVSEFMSYVMPNNVGRLKLYEDHTPLFSRFQIEHQIESAFSRSVSLPSGGAIVIDHTEALVSIDVNSARATRGADIEDTAFKTNMEAAEEVARQMRLRDLGGLVVIDFIDMENPKHQRDVENVLRDALKKDRARVQMGKLSRFGLLELSRQRLKPALGESSHAACPRCAGTGVIRGIESTALHVLRLIQDEAMKDNTGEVHAQVPVDVATFLLNEKRAELFGLEERLDVSVLLIPNIHLENPHYEITRVRIDDVEEDAEPSYKRVAEPEEDEKAKPFGSERAKAARPEPAVKGVQHTQPAPTVASVEAKPASWWENFKAWLARIFSGASAAEPEPDVVAEKAEKRGGHRDGSQSRRGQSRRQTPRRNGKRESGKIEVQEMNASAKEAKAADVKTDSRSEVKEGNRNRRERNRPNKDERHERSERYQASASAVAAPTNVQQIQAAQIEKAEQAAGKRSRNPRSQTRQQEKAAANEAVAVAMPAVEKVSDAESVGAEAAIETNVQPREHSSNRRESNQNRNQRDRRSNSKKRNIPSAEKIEHYLNIADASDKVCFAVAHVLGENALYSGAAAVSAENAVPAEPLVVVIPQVNDPVAPLPAVTVAKEAEKHGDGSVQVIEATTYEERVAIEAAVVGAPVASTSVLAGGEAEDGFLPMTAVPVEHEENVVAIMQAELVQKTDRAQTSPAAEAAPSERPELGGLEFVETRADAIAALADRSEPEKAYGRRRSDVPKVSIEDAPLEMVLVETRQG